MSICLTLEHYALLLVFTIDACESSNPMASLPLLPIVWSLYLASVSVSPLIVKRPHPSISSFQLGKEASSSSCLKIPGIPHKCILQCLRKGDVLLLCQRTYLVVVLSLHLASAF